MEKELKKIIQKVWNIISNNLKCLVKKDSKSSKKFNLKYHFSYFETSKIKT